LARKLAPRRAEKQARIIKQSLELGIPKLELGNEKLALHG